MAGAQDPHDVGAAGRKEIAALAPWDLTVFAAWLVVPFALAGTVR